MEKDPIVQGFLWEHAVIMNGFLQRDKSHLGLTNKKKAYRHSETTNERADLRIVVMN
jgi:hypothetical protein